MNEFDELKLAIYESGMNKDDIDLCLEALESCEDEDEFYETVDDVLCLMEARTRTDNEYADRGKESRNYDIKMRRPYYPKYGTQYERMSQEKQRRRNLKTGASRDSDDEREGDQRMYGKKNRADYDGSWIWHNGRYEDDFTIKRDHDKELEADKKLHEYRYNKDESPESNKRKYDKLVMASYGTGDNRSTKNAIRANLIRQVQNGHANERTKKYIHDTFGGEYDN